MEMESCSRRHLRHLVAAIPRDSTASPSVGMSLRVSDVTDPGRSPNAACQPVAPRCPHRRRRSRRRGLRRSRRRPDCLWRQEHDAHDPRHHRPPRQRLQLGLLQERRVRRRRSQRHRHRQGPDAGQGPARSGRQQPSAVSGTGPFTMAQVTNAGYPNANPPVAPIPDYNFDTIAGLDGRLTYDIDISEPVGSRITNLQYAGAPIDPTAEFAMAVNNYRQSGGGGFPAVKTSPVIDNRQIDIRQLLIDWVTANHTIDPAQFATVDWQLVSGGQPITVT
ncbi:MAG: 5'-nucleotidase C-terminal domain-containing protein [Nocardioides sp.]|nr:5'-nucleotidase C-terminal domain-containing protein [Nocardioides sp.]